LQLLNRWQVGASLTIVHVDRLPTLTSGAIAALVTGGFLVKLEHNNRLLSRTPHCSPTFGVNDAILQANDPHLFFTNFI
jgi:hypothetical protein